MNGGPRPPQAEARAGSSPWPPKPASDRPWKIQVCSLHTWVQVFEGDGCSVCNPRDREQTVVVQTITIEVAPLAERDEARAMLVESEKDCREATQIAKDALARVDQAEKQISGAMAAGEALDSP